MTLRKVGHFDGRAAALRTARHAVLLPLFFYANNTDALPCIQFGLPGRTPAGAACPACPGTAPGDPRTGLSCSRTGRVATRSTSSWRARRRGDLGLKGRVTVKGQRYILPCPLWDVHTALQGPGPLPVVGLMPRGRLPPGPPPPPRPGYPIGTNFNAPPTTSTR